MHLSSTTWQVIFYKSKPVCLWFKELPQNIYLVLKKWNPNTTLIIRQYRYNEHHLLPTERKQRQLNFISSIQVILFPKKLQFNFLFSFVSSKHLVMCLKICLKMFEDSLYLSTKISKFSFLIYCLRFHLFLKIYNWKLKRKNEFCFCHEAHYMLPWVK